MYDIVCCEDSVCNTIEENSGILSLDHNVLIAVIKGMWAIKCCFTKILCFSSCKISPSSFGILFQLS